MSPDGGATRVRLTAADELLYRLVHPGFVHDGRVSSQALRPTPKDEHLLSVDRSQLSTPQQSYDRFVKSGFEAAGIVAVTVGECDEQSLSVLSDPLPPCGERPANPAHALVDFREKPSNRARDKAGKCLARKARERGWLLHVD